VLLSASGERPPAASTRVRPARLRVFGRAALRTLYALDNGPDIAEPPTRDIVVRGKVLPAWAVRMLVGVLLLPPLLAGVDGFARLRRRHEPVGSWMGWTLTAALPFAVACLFAIALAAVGLIAVAPGAPVPGAALDLGGGAIVALVSVLLVFVLSWLVLRPMALRATGARGRPETAGAAMGVGLVTCATAVALWIVNPYAAALVVPAAHLWLWATVPETRIPRAGALALVLAGLLPMALVLLSDGRAFGLGGVEAVWFWLLLVAGGHVPAVSWLLWSLVWGCAVAAALVAVRRPRRARDDGEPGDVTVRGPLSYAGPGSLGGTESALRR
jgi:hypothetical protein